MKDMNPVISKLSKLKNPIKAKILAGFFKTGKGEYGEGDIFWGINVPDQRKIAKEFIGLSNPYLEELLKSGVHEQRLTALLILTYQYEKFADKRKKIFDFYVKNIRYINNWDLVDVTAPRIIGAYLFGKKDSNHVDAQTKVSTRKKDSTETKEGGSRELLYKLVHSKKLWEKRIAIISTLYFIKQGDFSDTLKIAEILLKDNNDLIHKAVGWMLREVGKKDEVILHNFLKKYSKEMPRTALRYSIERLPEEYRKHYLK